MSSVVVFGSINMDLAIECDRMPRRGETIAGGGLLINPGGKGANQAVAAARFGAPTYLIGAVGQDLFGERLVSTLGEYGVNCNEVRRIEGAETGAAVVLRSGGDNRIILSPGSNHMLSAGFVEAALERVAHAGDVFLSQLECDLDTTVAALRVAHRRGMTTILNAAPACELPAETWGSVDILCVNETECEALCGILPSEEAVLPGVLASLAELGVQAVVITLGERGSAAVLDGRFVRQQAVSVEVEDTTAAGDTFVGVLASALLGGRSLREGMVWASYAASLAASKSGAQQSIPSYEDVAGLMAKRGEGSVS